MRAMPAPVKQTSHAAARLLSPDGKERASLRIDSADSGDDRLVTVRHGRGNRDVELIKTCAGESGE